MAELNKNKGQASQTNTAGKENIVVGDQTNTTDKMAKAVDEAKNDPHDSVRKNKSNKQNDADTDTDTSHAVTTQKEPAHSLNTDKSQSKSDSGEKTSDETSDQSVLNSVKKDGEKVGASSNSETKSIQTSTEGTKSNSTMAEKDAGSVGEELKCSSSADIDAATNADKLRIVELEALVRKQKDIIKKHKKDKKDFKATLLLQAKEESCKHHTLCVESFVRIIKHIDAFVSNSSWGWWLQLPFQIDQFLSTCNESESNKNESNKSDNSKSKGVSTDNGASKKKLEGFLTKVKNANSRISSMEKYLRVANIMVESSRSFATRDVKRIDELRKFDHKHCTYYYGSSFDVKSSVNKFYNAVNVDGAAHFELYKDGCEKYKQLLRLEEYSRLQILESLVKTLRQQVDGMAEKLHQIKIT